MVSILSPIRAGRNLFDRTKTNIVLGIACDYHQSIASNRMYAVLKDVTMRSFSTTAVIVLVIVCDSPRSLT